MKIPMPEEAKAALQESARVMKEMNDTLLRVENLLQQMLDKPDTL